MTTINSTIGTSTAANAWAFGGAAQRYAFPALGRFWVFYSDGTNMVWKTTTDGLSWSAATTVRACVQGYRFSIAFDGTNVHYTYCSHGTGDDINYRMGAIASDGTISWLAAEQIAVAVDVNHQTHDTHIATDSNGFPWIAYGHTLVSDETTLAWVTKSKTKDGTWTAEDTLFTAPYQFSASTFEHAGAAPMVWCASVPLSGGQVYAIAQPGWNALDGTEKDIKGRFWDGSVWGNEETVAVRVNAILSASISPVVDSHDNIFLTYRDYESVGATRTAYFVIRTDSTGLWGTPASFITANPNGGESYTCMDTNDIVYHFYQEEPTTKHIYYKRYVNGAWEDPVDWITETAAFSDIYGSYQSAALKGNLGKIIYTYVTLTVSPFDVKMAALEFLNERAWGQK